MHLCTSYATKLEESYKDQSISLFPNPIKDILCVELEEAKYTVLMILNSQGKKVIEQYIERHDKLEISTESLAPGIYFLNLFDVNKYITECFAKY